MCVTRITHKPLLESNPTWKNNKKNYVCASNHNFHLIQIMQHCDSNHKLHLIRITQLLFAPAQFDSNHILFSPAQLDSNSHCHMTQITHFSHLPGGRCLSCCIILVTLLKSTFILDSNITTFFHTILFLISCTYKSFCPLSS